MKNTFLLHRSSKQCFHIYIYSISTPYNYYYLFTAPSVPTDPPQINPSPDDVPLPTNYPSDPIGHNTLTFVLPLPPEDDGELTVVFIIVQESLKDSNDSNKLRRK